MFHDKDTNVLYLATALRRFPDIYNHLMKQDVDIHCIDNTLNIWSRDYMPVQVKKDKFVLFNYTGNAKKYPQLNINQVSYNGINRIVRSSINLDGGNVVGCGDKVIMTDIIFKHNPDEKKDVLIAKLEKLLEAEIIIIPKEPYDSMGHADGIVRFVEKDAVFVNHYHEGKYVDKLLKILWKHNLVCLPFPYAPDKMRKMTALEFRKNHPLADSFNPGVGYYINYLQVDGFILVPSFGFEEDAQAVQCLKEQFPESKIESLDCMDLAMEGGLFHCVTMNYRMPDDSA